MRTLEFRMLISLLLFCGALPLSAHADSASSLPAGDSEDWWAQIQKTLVPEKSLATEASWAGFGENTNDYYGSSVATAGDVNGDGFSDVIVGAYRYASSRGRVYVYHGSASGLSTVPNWMAETSQSGCRFGRSISTAGDVNGDGYSDIIVGAQYYNNGSTSEGAAFVWLGSASGLGDNGTPANADWMVESNQATAFLGSCVSTAGDVNGDGFSDIIVGSHYYDNGHSEEGGAFVWLGSASGLGANGNPFNADWMAEGDQATSFLGSSVAAAGDINGDGYGDIVVGAIGYDGGVADEGSVFVWLGSASGLGPNGSPGNADWSATGYQAGANLGICVSTAGDINGDGYADVLAGAHAYDNGAVSDSGAAFLWLGSASGLGANGSPANADWSCTEELAGSYLGYTVATAGDVNGDGYADILVGALYRTVDAVTGAGTAFMWYGSAAGLGTSGTTASADWRKEGQGSYESFGASVAPAGDVNGDGYADTLVGGYGYTSYSGRALLYQGAAGGPAAISLWTNDGEAASGGYGGSVSTAGDVNGDGYADVIVGACQLDSNTGRVYVYHGSPAGLSATPNWTASSGQAGSRFGSPVASAGDVNGDGYSDVIVGAHLYDNGLSNEGAIFVWLGSASGLGANGTPANADWIAEADQTGACLGYSASTAGDVNGDGYSDIIVGAYNYDIPLSAEGALFVWLGSAAGLGANGTPANADWIAEGEQANACLGVCVSTAGDINGDGYSDVIAGASKYDSGYTDEGAAFVWLGSASGLGPNGSPFNAEWTAVSYQAQSDFGQSVATAGDVNADGYGDIIVGAHTYTGAIADEGAAFVWLGSASGLGFNGTPANADWSVIETHNYSWLGHSVAPAGDVNGDGYADILIGAPHRNISTLVGAGVSFVWFGSAAGLGTPGDQTTADWTKEGDQAYAMLGNAVATAGDVNGDGYADVLAAADAYNTSTGRAYLNYGNGDTGLGLALNPRQRRSDDAGPIAPNGICDSDTSIRLKALGRTPFGRTKVKFECEVKPAGVPFDGSGTTTSVEWADTGAAGIELNQAMNGLDISTPYHCRVRLRYQPAATPFQQASRWVGMGNGAGETDFRTAPDMAPPNISFPAGGGTPIYLGCPYTLTWSASVAAGPNIKLKLWKGGVFNQWISGPTPNDGSFRWTPPLDLPAACNYQIQIYSASNPSVVNLSGAFCIEPSPLKITHANGGERFLPGDPVRFTWTTEPDVGASVKMKLFKGGAFHTWISGGSPNNGTLNWIFPVTLPYGDDYTLQLYSVTDFTDIDYSDASFSIAANRLRMLGPNGGDRFTQGATYDITWDTAGVVGDNVKLKLWKGTVLSCWIAGSTPNDGSFRWTVPADLSDGDDYRIQIYSATDFSIVDASDAPFSLGPAPVSISAPNGGEAWIAGTSHAITWTWIGDIGASVKIKLYKGGVFQSWICGGTANDGRYNWVIPPGTPPGTNYKIQIYSATDYGILDFSNSAFTIAAPSGE